MKFADISDTCATVSWKPPLTDGGKPVKQYIIEYRDTRKTTWLKSGSCNVNMTTFTVTRLIEGNEYMFRVRAANEVGEGEPLASMEPITAEKPASK